MSAATPPALPKAGSGAWKDAWKALLKVLDAPRAVLVIEGAMDGRATAELVQRLSRGGGRPGDAPRAELVGRLVDVFLRASDAAWAIAKELDKHASKERFIVASMDEESLDERLNSYRAVDFRRERARLVWALLRDGRAAHTAGAVRILDAAFAQMEKTDKLDAAVSSEGGVDDATLLQIKERLATYESELVRQQRDLAAGARERAEAERERSELMVRVGQRELALKDEERLRREAEEELARLKADHASALARLTDAERALSPETRQELERLRERTRALDEKLQKKKAHEARAAAGDTAESLARQLDDAQRAHKKEVERLQRELAEAAERVATERERAERLKDDLRAARIALAAPGQAPRPDSSLLRVGVFADTANLSASARRDFGSKLDFRALLEHVLEQRKKACAIAFVVKEGEAYGGFAASLRDAGYELFEKTPKVRADGSRKADWDMGIAMEILERLDEVDVVVLCSGDGDFVPLIKRIKRAGKRVEVAAFRAATDDALVRAADLFVPLDGRFRMSA